MHFDDYIFVARVSTGEMEIHVPIEQCQTQVPYMRWMLKIILSFYMSV